MLRHVPRYLLLALIVGGVAYLGVRYEQARVVDVPPPVVTYVQAIATAQCKRIAFVVLIRSDGTFRVLTDPTPEQIAVINLAIPDPARKTTIYLECGVST